ncbi:MAG TPA: ROK family protein [Actinocrinis sp.]|jgi:predicted NBD/HSP70 family sugar kinase
MKDGRRPTAAELAVEQHSAAEPAAERHGAAKPAVERIKAAIEVGDGVTRGALSTGLGLPLGTVTTAVAALIRSGAVVERQVGVGGRSAGRPAVELVSAGPARTLGAVIWTLGRLQTAIATYGGTILERSEIEVAAQDTTRIDLLEPALRAVCRRVEAPDREYAAPDRVVIGVPAPFQRGVGTPYRKPVPAQTASDAEATESGAETALGHSPRPDPGQHHRHEHNHEHSEQHSHERVGAVGFAPWLSTDPAAELGARLGVPVLVENDANLGALGEAGSGAGRGFSSVLYIKLGERSVGAGLVLDGRLHRGSAGFAGELAHIHMDDDGPLCACGARGCLANRFKQPLLELMQSGYDRPLTFAEVLRLAEAGEPGPTRVLREVGRSLGRPLADLCTFLNPAVLVLDAALGAAGRHVQAGISEQIERYAAPAAAAALRIGPGSLGFDADIVGAVHLARSEALG